MNGRPDHSVPATPLPTADIPAPPTTKQRIPWWGWPFAAACGIIPFLTLGGAIPGAIGAGGFFGCLAVARSQDLPSLGRAAICTGIVILCWIALLVLLLALAPGPGQP